MIGRFFSKHSAHGSISRSLIIGVAFFVGVVALLVMISWPALIRSRANAVQLLVKECRYVEAVKRFPMIIKESPDPTELYFGYGVSLYHRGQYEPAAAMLERYLKGTEGSSSSFPENIKKARELLDEIRNNTTPKQRRNYTWQRQRMEVDWDAVKPRP